MLRITTFSSYDTYFLLLDKFLHWVGFYYINSNHNAHIANKLNPFHQDSPRNGLHFVEDNCRYWVAHYFELLFHNSYIHNYTLYSTLNSLSGATFYYTYSLPAFRLPLHRLLWGEDNKKARTPILSGVKALALPEVKIRKAVRALWARSALSSALLRSNLRDSHFQTGGIATDYMPQIYTFFILAKKKNATCTTKKPALLFPLQK